MSYTATRMKSSGAPGASHVVIPNHITTVRPVTDATGGIAADTLDPVEAGPTYTQADAVAMKNAIATLANRLNLAITALHNAGIAVSHGE